MVAYLVQGQLPSFQIMVICTVKLLTYRGWSPTTSHLYVFLPQVGGSKFLLNSYNKTNEMHQFLKFIFGIELYMFRTGFLSIIRSLVLYTQQ